jgi:hypothetical protein
MDMVSMRALIFISILFLTACKNQIDIDQIEQKEHGLSYIRGTDNLVTGEVVRKFENGRIAERHSYKDGKAIGDWYAYGYDGETVSHGFGIDGKKYQSGISNVDLTYSFLSLNIEGSFTFATFYLDNKKLFNDPKTLVALSKEVFIDYSDKYKIDEILIYDNEHEYTISKTATLTNTFKIDTVKGKDKQTVFIK